MTLDKSMLLILWLKKCSHELCNVDVYQINQNIDHFLLKAFF